MVQLPPDPSLPLPGQIGGPFAPAPGYPPPPPSIGPYARPPRSGPVDGLAIATLVTGVLSLVPVAIGLGIAALVRINRGNRRGMALAVAGLVAAGLWLVVVVGVIAYRHGRDVSRDASGSISRAGQISPRDLEYGDCLEVPLISDKTISRLTAMPCSQPHNGQVFDVLQASDSTYPGEDRLKQEALAACQQEAPGFLGTAQTLLHVVTFVPTSQGWNLGDRAESCLLVDRRKDVRGDIRADR